MVKAKKILVLELDECLDECIKSKLLTEKEAGKIIEYLMSGEGGNYNKLCWGDIEEENGMEPDEATAFRKFYEKYKKYEKGTKDYMGITFDTSIYS